MVSVGSPQPRMERMKIAQNEGVLELVGVEALEDDKSRTS